MENVYLNSDESILLTNQNIVVDGIRHEAILTSSRLILVHRDNPKAPAREIPLAAISSAIAGENALHEPMITLSLTAPDGSLQTVPLVFIRLVSEQRNNQYGEWIARLRERVTVTVEEPKAVHIPGLTGKESQGPQELPLSPGQQIQQGIPNVPSYVFRPPRPVTLPRETDFSKLAVLIIAVAAFALVGIIAAQVFYATPVPPPATQNVPPAGQTAQATPAVQPTPVVTAAPVVNPPVPFNPIPPTGTWVRVQYPGNYTGLVGARGRMQEVNSTGDRFFQISAVSGTVTAEIRKMDGSGNDMAVEFYKDGGLVRRVNSTKPYAVYYLHTEI